VGELIPEMISADLRENITHASGGNPLFITEMLAMARATGGDVGVPPTLQPCSRLVSTSSSSRTDRSSSAERSKARSFIAAPFWPLRTRLR
jgi:hypothetical protein